MKSLYQALQTQIQTQCPSLMQVGFYNRQFEETNHDEADLNTQQAVMYPCCFIEFPEDNPQMSAGAGAKRLDVLVRFWIGLVSYNLEPLEMFDVAQSVQAAVENFTDKASFGPLTYFAQRVCHDYTNVVIYQYDYKTVYMDNIKYIYNDAILKNGNTINVTLNPTNPI